MSFKRLPEGMQAEVVSVGPKAKLPCPECQGKGGLLYEPGLIVSECSRCKGTGIDTYNPLPEFEKAFQARVVAYARRCGWTLIYHTYDSRRSQEGFPDLLMLRGKKIIVAELKVPPNAATEAQLRWLDGFRAAKVPAYLWTPEDWAEIVKVLE